MSMDFLIHHMLRTTALQSPDKEALVYKKDRLTYDGSGTKNRVPSLGFA